MHRLFVILIALVSGSHLVSAGRARAWTLFRHPSPFYSYSTGDGLSQGSVLAICQDRRGFMWFGTEDGLNRFDGYRFVIHKPDPSRPGAISDNIVQALFVDSSGRMWAGTGSGGLCRYDPDKESFTVFRHIPEAPSSLASDAVTVIFQDRQGSLWIGTDDSGLDIMQAPAQDGGNARFSHHAFDPGDPDSLASHHVSALFQDREGRIWIGTDRGLCLHSPPAPEESSLRFRRFAVPDGQMGRRSADAGVVTAINEDEFGMLWIGTQDGLYRFNPKLNLWTPFRHDPTDGRSLSHDRVRVVFRDKMDNLWIGTDGGGLNRMTGNDSPASRPHFLRFQFHARDLFGLKSNAVESLCEDRGGVLWIGLYYGGVDRIILGGTNREARELEKIVQYQSDPVEDASLSHNFVSSICESRSGVVYIGTDGGGLNGTVPTRGRGEPLRFRHYRHQEADVGSLADDVVTALCEDRGGQLWIGTYTRGLDRMVGNGESGKGVRFVHYRHDANDPRTLGSDFVVSIHEDRQGALWIGTIGGGLNLMNADRRTFTRFQNDDGNPASIIDDNVNSILEDRRGHLWVGTVEGLELLDRRSGTFRHFRHDPLDAHSLSANYVRVIAEDSRGRVWIGTNGGGLNRMRLEENGPGPDFVHYREADGLCSNVVVGILEDEQGQLWLSTGRGLCCFDPETARFKNYSLQGDVQKDEFSRNAFCRSRSGEMFFGGTKGLYIFHPDDLHQNRQPPPVVLTTFSLFNKPVPLGRMADGRVILSRPITETDQIRLSYRDNAFSFEFAALDFSMPERNQYAYRMEGMETEWNESGSRRFVNYMNLPYGRYTFRVRASNSDGVWNREGVGLGIVIAPPFWKTTWFKLLAILFLASAVFSLYRLRIRQLQHQRRVLERLVELRTEELKEASLKDPLTDLWNRRFIDEVLIYDLLAFIADRRYLLANPEERRRRNGEGVYGIILIDIDHFKMVNDQYGHAVGDQLLIMFSEILKKSVRADDVVIRFGGEEFLIVLKSCDIPFLDDFARRIKEGVEAHEFLIAGQTIKKTCSLGYTHFPFYEEAPDHLDLDKVMMIADWGLYHAKNHGRNMGVRITPGARVLERSELDQFVFFLGSSDQSQYLTVTSFR